jgi:hypothetical protein
MDHPNRDEKMDQSYFENVSAHMDFLSDDTATSPRPADSADEQPADLRLGDRLLT